MSTPEYRYRLTIGLSDNFTGDKVRAVKAFRSTFGFCLAEAKQAVDFYQVEYMETFTLPSELTIDLTGDHVARQLWTDYKRENDPESTHESWFWVRRLERNGNFGILDATKFRCE